MNYKQLIIELVQKIDNEKALRKIYALVNRIFVRECERKSKGSGITTVALFSALISLYLAKYRHMSANNREGGYI